MIHSYPWYITDWRESEAVLAMTMEQRALYRELLDMCWREGSLPIDERTLRKFGMAEQDEFDRCWSIVKKQFKERDGRLWNAKVDEKRPEVLKSKEDRSRGGKIRAESAPREKGRFLPNRTSSAGYQLPADDQLPPPAEHQPPPSPSLPLVISKSIESSDLNGIPSALRSAPLGVLGSSNANLFQESEDGDISILKAPKISAPRNSKNGSGQFADDFAEWWSLQLRKENKYYAEKVYYNYRKLGVKHSTIMEAQRRCNEQDLQYREVGHRPHPSTWLNQQHWLDEKSPEPTKRPEEMDELDRLKPPPRAPVFQLPEPGAKYAK